MSLFACSNKKINSIEKENIFLSIFWIIIIIFYFYFDSLLVYLHVLLKKLYIFDLVKIILLLNILLYLMMIHVAVKKLLIQVPNSLFITGEVYYKSQFMVNIRVILPLVLKDAFYGFIMVFIVSLRELVTAKLLQSTFFYIM